MMYIFTYRINEIVHLNKKRIIKLILQKCDLNKLLFINIHWIELSIVILSKL